MKENKLSREDIIETLGSMERIYIDMTHVASRPDEFRLHVKDCVNKIKSLLIPIPEDKLDEFVEKWVLKFPVACAVDYKLNQKNIKVILKEYDKLRRG